MLAHDEFRELGALAAIGQITASEQEDLSAHLRKCAECREAYADYSRILRQDLPQADPARFRGKQTSLHPANDAELRERFLARAHAQGANFSPEVDQRITVDRGPTPALRMRLTLATAAVFVIAAGLTLVLLINEKKTAEARPANPVPLVSQNESLQRQLDEATRRVDALSNDVSALSAHAGDLTGALREKDVRLVEAKHNLDQLRAELDQMRTQNSSLVAAREQDQSLAAELKSRIQMLEGTNATSVAAMVELQDKIHSLNAALEQQSEKLTMESQLTSVSSDVRQLMGARNLHIIDVHDVNGTGKSAKSFGRVFYSEGQSLVFYAFDLPNGKLTPAKYHFQAWGQQEGKAQSVRNLGTFSIDDREQHRWVLKVSDASLLRGMDSVFVTAETVGDVSGPRGKRVLYAYLAGRPNHP